MMHLRQSTASQSVLIGPFVDSTDGNTVESGLTIDAADIRLSKNGANIVGKNSGGGTHDELGYYTITLDATDTNTVGRLQLMVHESGALPVYHEYEVLEEAAYDAIYASSADPKADVNVASIDNNAITAASIAADALTAAKFASDVTTELQSGLATASALSTLDGKVDTIDNFLDTEVAAILADTNELQTDLADGGRLDLLIDAIKAKTDNLPSDPADASVIAGRFDTLDTSVADLPTNAELATALGTADDAVLAQVALVKTETDKIAAVKAKTDSLTFTQAGHVDANIQMVNDVTIQGDGQLGTEWSPA